MKTTILATLLLLSTLTVAGTAQAGPVEDAVAIAGAVVLCVLDIVGPDGNNEHIIITLPVDVIDQHPVCLN